METATLTEEPIANTKALRLKPGSEKSIILNYLNKYSADNYTAEELHHKIPELNNSLRGSIRRILTELCGIGAIFICGRRRSSDTNKLIWAYSVLENPDFKLPSKKARKKKRNPAVRLITVEIPITSSQSPATPVIATNNNELLTECLEVFGSVQKAGFTDLFVQAQVADITDKLAKAISSPVS